jgi:UDP-N-acetylmuramyl pentapeptide synthase
MNPTFADVIARILGAIEIVKALGPALEHAEEVLAELETCARRLQAIGRVDIKADHLTIIDRRE